MRTEINKINIKGRVVIGEGEMDEAPMLFIGENVGTGIGEEIDIAVDPLEGTNFTAKNLPNAISVLAVTRKGDLLSAPDTYMEKIAVGPNLPNNLLDLDNSVEKNIKLLAEAKNTQPDKLTACVLKRSRHDKIIQSLKTKTKGRPGVILNEKFAIGCNDGSITPVYLQREGKKIMHIDELLRGFRFKIGDKLNE